MPPKKAAAKKATKKAPNRGKRAASVEKPKIDKSKPWNVDTDRFLKPGRKTAKLIMAEFGIGISTALKLVAAEIEEIASLGDIPTGTDAPTVVLNWEDKPVFAGDVLHFMFKCYYDAAGAEFDLNDLDLSTPGLVEYLAQGDPDPKG